MTRNSVDETSAQEGSWEQEHPEALRGHRQGPNHSDEGGAGTELW
jgi:hypothetical protein